MLPLALTLALGLAACGDDTTDAASTTTAGPASTTSAAPTTTAEPTTTTAGPTTTTSAATSMPPTSVTEPASRPDVPADYAQAAFDAWQAGDDGTLRDLTSDDAYAALVGRPPSADDGFGDPKCEGAAGSTYCRWVGTTEALVLRVGNEAASRGQSGALMEAYFEAP
jgi:hypothetical protein